MANALTDLVGHVLSLSDIYVVATFCKLYELSCSLVNVSQRALALIQQCDRNKKLNK